MTEIKKVKIIIAIIIGVLIVSFCLRNILYTTKTEAVFVLHGSKEVIGNIIKKEFSSGRKSTTYYITYKFSPEDSESITKKIRIYPFEWHFIREGQDIPILYQKYNDEILYRPKAWNLRSYDFFRILVMVYTTTSLTICYVVSLIVSEEEMKSEKYKTLKKKLGWMLIVMICGFIAEISFSNLKFFFFASSAKAHIEEIGTAENEFLFKYGFDDNKKNHHTITVFAKDKESCEYIEKHKDDIALDVIYKKSDPKIHYFGKRLFMTENFYFPVIR